MQSVFSAFHVSIDPVNNLAKMNIPGPGTYGTGIEMNKIGVYQLSTISNSKAAAWSPSKKRFDEEELRSKRSIPGPGNYNPSDYNAGQYLLSNFKTYGTRKYIPDSFTSSKKRPKNITPGPGSYAAPSDFGYVENPKFCNTAQSSRSPPRLNRNMMRTAQTD